MTIIATAVTYLNGQTVVLDSGGSQHVVGPEGLSLQAPGGATFFDARPSSQDRALAMAAADDGNLMLTTAPGVLAVVDFSYDSPGGAFTLTSALTTGAPITSLPANVSAGEVPSGAALQITSGANSQTFTASGASTSGAIPVTSQTPSYAFPTSSTCAFNYAYSPSATFNYTMSCFAILNLNTTAATDVQLFPVALPPGWSGPIEAKVLAAVATTAQGTLSA